MNSIVITEANKTIVDFLNGENSQIAIIFANSQLLDQCKSMGFSVEDFYKRSPTGQVYVENKLIAKDRPMTNSIDDLLKEADLKEKERTFISKRQQEKEESIKRQLENIKLQMDIDRQLVPDINQEVRQNIHCMLDTLYCFRVCPEQSGIGEQVTLEPAIDEEGRQEIQFLILKKLRQL